MDRRRRREVCVRLGGEHAVDGPREVDGGRTGSANALRRGREGAVVGVQPPRERDAVRAEDADAGRAAHRKRRDRGDDGVDRRRAGPHDLAG